MPQKVGRPRKYFTEEEQKAADCAKSKKYYASKKKLIAKRRKKARKLEKQSKRSANDQEASSGSPSQHTAPRRPTQTELLLAEIEKINQKLLIVTEGQTDFQWLSSLCSSYSELQVTDVAAAADILDDAHTQITRLNASLCKWQHEILNLCGLGKEYATGESSRRRMEGLMRELSELEGHALLGPAELADLYARSKLPFQQ